MTLATSPSHTPQHRTATARYISLAALLAVIAVMGLMSYRVMAGFLLPLFLAALLAALFHPIHVRFLAWCRGRHATAAGLTTALVLMIVLLPMAGIVGLALFEAQQTLGNLPQEKNRIDQRIGKLRDGFGLSMPFAPQIQGIQKGLQEIHERDRDPAAEVTDAAPEKQMLADVAALQARLAAEVARVSQLALPTPPGGLRRFSPYIHVESMVDPALRDDPAVTWEESEAFRVSRLAREPETFQQLQRELNDLLQRCEVLQELATVSHRRHDYRVALVEAESLFQSIQGTLFGGSIRGLLVQFGSPSKEQIDSWIVLGRDRLQEWLPSITGQATSMMARMLVGVSIMTVAMFYFLADGSAMIHAIMRLSPLDDRYEAELLREFDTVSRAVVLATLLSALTQGILAGIGYYFAGAEKTILLTLVTTVLALVPFIGSTVVWIPVCLWLILVEERVFAGTALAIYCATIVSTIDNFIKPYILHGQSRLHPLLALLSVLGGVQTLGPVGLIVGPMVVSFLQALLNMLRSELAEIQETLPGLSEPVAPALAQVPVATSTLPEPPAAASGS